MVLSSVRSCGMQWFARAAVLAVVAWVHAAASAQTIQSTGNVNISPSLTTHVNASVAINPTNPKNVVAFSALTQATGLYSGVSTNGGASFTPGIIADGTTALPAAGGSPSCAWDAFGNLFVAYRDVSGNSIAVAFSTDGGRNFTLLQTFNGVGLMQPKLATGPDSSGVGETVWLAYYDTANTSIFTTGSLVTAIGTPGAFAVAQGIGGTTGAILGDIVVGPNGEVVVAYEISAAPAGPSTIFTAFDDDGLGPDTFVSNGIADLSAVGSASPIPAAPNGISAAPSLAFDYNNFVLYLVYVDDAGNGDTNIFVDSSGDDGATWNGPVQVNDDTGTNAQFLPRIAVDQITGFLAVTYYGAQNDLGDNGIGDTNGIANDDVQVFVTVSEDFGATFLANTQLSGGTSNAAKANTANGTTTDLGAYTGLAFNNNNIVAVWSDNSNSTVDNPSGGLAQLNLYTNSTQLVSPVVVAPDPANKPDLVVTSITINGTPTAGFPFTLIATITNNNTGDAGPFYVSAFSDPSFVGFRDGTQTDFSVADPANAKKVDTVYVPGLAGGASVDVQLTMLYNVSGDATVAVLADSQSNDAETDELNNELDQRLLVLSVGPDIAVRSDANSGSPAMVASVQSAPIDVSPVGATEAGNVVTITTTAPLNLVAGEPVLVTGVAVPEYNGTFVVATAPDPMTFTYTIAATGLAPSGGGTASKVPGIEAHFDYTLVNLGNQPTGPFTVGFYNNRATAPTSADVPDQTFPVPQMLPGDVLNLSFDLPVQNTPRGGRAWVFADYQNVVVESVETNNTGSAVWGVPNDAPAILSPVVASVQTVQAGDVVTFTVAAGDPNGDTLFYTWNFGDGTAPVGGGSTITHIYTAPGIYTATVSVSDGPFTNVVSSVKVEVLDSVIINLGFVISKSDYIKLALPLPPGITKKDRYLTTIIQGNAGLDVRLKNQILTGVPGAPGTYTFTVEYRAPKIKTVSAPIKGVPFGAFVNGTSATIITSKPHRLAVNQMVLISGVDDPGYNGTFLITSVLNAKSFTYTPAVGVDTLGTSGGGFATRSQPALVRVRYSYTVLP